MRTDVHAGLQGGSEATSSDGRGVGLAMNLSGRVAAGRFHEAGRGSFRGERSSPPPSRRPLPRNRCRANRAELRYRGELTRVAILRATAIAKHGRRGRQRQRQRRRQQQREWHLAGGDRGGPLAPPPLLWRPKVRVPAEREGRSGERAPSALGRRRSCGRLPHRTASRRRGQCRLGVTPPSLPLEAARGT